MTWSRQPAFVCMCACMAGRTYALELPPLPACHALVAEPDCDLNRCHASWFQASPSALLCEAADVAYDA